MKNIQLFIIFVFFIFISCKKTNFGDSLNFKNSEPVEKKQLPIGFKKLIDYDFPANWNNLQIFNDQNPNLNINEISKTGYDSISYFIKKYYSSLYDSITINKKIKLQFIPKINNDESNYSKIDSCYYGKTFLETNKYILKLYKNGDKYDNLSGSENLSIVKYLVLVTFNKQNNSEEYLTIYYNNNDLYQYYDKYFYIDENKNITLKYFFVDELEHHFLGEEKWSINSEGKFIKINATPEKLNNNNNNNNNTEYDLTSLTILYKNTSWDGAYYIKTKIISDETNEVSNVEYFLAINNGLGKLRIEAENQKDEWCEGEYYLRKGKGFIYGSGSCDQDDLNDFMMKKENENYYIKSKFFINKNWLLLKKLKADR